MKESTCNMSLLNLHVELVQIILIKLSDLETLENTVLAGPAIKEAFIGRRTPIIESVLSNLCSAEEGMHPLKGPFLQGPALKMVYKASQRLIEKTIFREYVCRCILASVVKNSITFYNTLYVASSRRLSLI